MRRAHFFQTWTGGKDGRLFRQRHEKRERRGVKEHVWDARAIPQPLRVLPLAPLMLA